MDSKDKAVELPDYNESQAKAQVQPEAQPQEQSTRLQSRFPFLQRWKPNFKNWLPYDEKLTVLEFIVFLLCVFFPISFVVFISGAQTFVLDSLLGQRDNLGYYTSVLGVADQIVSIIMVVVWGIISDKLGRKFVFTVGFILTGLSIICFPYVKNVSVHLVLVRMFFGFGSSATLAMLTASLSDVRGVRHGGKLTGLVGVVSGCGALLGSFVWLKLLATFPLKNQNELPFIIVGVVSIAWGIIVFFFYQSPKVNGIINEVAPLTDIKTHTIRFWKALKLGYKRPVVGLGYIGGFVARGDTLILSTFVILWVSTFFRKYGLCENVNNDLLKDTCPGAFGFGHALTGIGQTCAIVGAPFFGVALEYIPNQYVLVVSSIFAFVGYFGLAANKIPFYTSSFVYTSMIGITEIGTIVCSMKALSDAENVEKTERGNISGVYSFFGSIGILVSTTVGGYIFDKYGGASPLYLVGGYHVLLAVFAAIVCVHHAVVRVAKWRRDRASSN